MSTATETSVPVLASYFSPVVASAVVSVNLSCNVVEPAVKGSSECGASIFDLSVKNESTSTVSAVDRVKQVYEVNCSITSNEKSCKRN